MRIAINGFGRIGKNFLRTIMQDINIINKLQVIAINIGPSDIQAIAYSFKYDTLMGTYPYDVKLENNSLVIDDSAGKKHTIFVIAQKDINLIDWSKFSIDWVVDSSGKFTDRIGAQKHLESGAKAVLITAPATGEDITIIPGVNSDIYEKNKHKIVSLGSCTTNALVPLLHVLETNYGIEQAYMTTVHAYTNSQVLLDVDATSKDLRRNRAAALNIIPTTTGAMKVVDRIIPSIRGKIFGCSLRVPVATVSLVDLTFITKQKISLKNLQDSFDHASNTYLKDILAVSYVPLVSSDYAVNSNSVTVDMLMTQAFENTGKLFGWYDNEWGYSMRLRDFLVSII